MLFYVFLFAMSQEVHRQRAWVKSFGSWIMLDIVIVSSFTVLITHMVIPAITMRDVRKIRGKLVESFAAYQQKIVEDRQLGHIGDSGSKLNSSSINHINDNKSFNAANILFLSHRVANEFASLRVAQIIVQFKTPWPRQSYQHVDDVGKSYTSKFSGLTRAFSTVIMFVLSSFVTLPSGVQDLMLQCTGTVITSYIIVVHLRLYHVYPLMVVVPSLLLLAICFVVFKTSKTVLSNVQLARLQHMAEEKQQKGFLLQTNYSPLSNDQLHLRTPSSIAQPTLEETKVDVGIGPHVNRRQSLVVGVLAVKRAQELLSDIVPCMIDGDHKDSESDSSFQSDLYSLSCTETAKKTFGTEFTSVSIMKDGFNLSDDSSRFLKVDECSSSKGSCSDETSDSKSVCDHSLVTNSTGDFVSLSMNSDVLK
jgi:hypothetical protein